MQHLSVLTDKKATKNDKDGEEITKNISYEIKLIDVAKFMESLLSNLYNNLAEGIHKIKRQNSNTCRIKYKDCYCCLEYTSFNDNLIEYKRFSCNKK